jgi:peptide/nickel transport system substrate-binding protein
MKKPGLALALLLVVVACGSPQAPPPFATADGPPARGGAVVIGLLADVQNWNPYVVEDLDTEHVLALIYPSLAIEQTDYHRHPPSFEPSLAESWSWSEDHLVLTIELDPDARWADGVPVTAKDVVFTWQVQTSPEIDWLYGDGKEFIESVVAVSDHTVRVAYTHRYPYQFMDLNDGLIIPAHAWAEIPFDRWSEIDWRERVLGGGPFDLAGHTPQQQITLERNPHYHRPGLPYLDSVVFRIVPSEQGLVTQLLAGELDFVRSINPSNIDRVRTHQDLQLVIYDDRSYTHVCWNTEKPLLADPRIRRALSSAIDRETLIDVVYGGFGRLGVGPVLSSFWAFNRDLEPVPFDPDAARDAFEAAGWSDTDGDGFLDKDGNDFAIELLAPAENELRQDLAILIQEDLKRIGVKAEPRFVEWGTLMAAMQDGEFDALVNGWEEPTQIDLAGLWESAPPGEPTFNFGRYSNPEVDRLLIEVGDMTDFAEQKPVFDRIQALIVADQPYTFLVENTRITAHTSRVKGVDANAATPYFNIDEWYVKTEPAGE